MKASKILALGATLVAVAVIVVLALVGKGVRTYPPGSPEATMQTYLQALFDDEPYTAHTFLSPPLQRICDRSDLRNTPAMYRDLARIVDVDVADSTAEVRVEMTEGDSGLFDGGYTTEHEFSLERIDGAWQISKLAERFECR